MASVLSECSICYDAVIDHPAPEGSEATGSYRSSCGHLFHPKCIAKWHVRQENSTCPMCRKEAVEMEDCAVAPESESEEEDEDDDEEDEEEEYGGGVIRLSRASLEYILRDFGGVGMTAGVEAEVEINEFNEVVIERFELERILQEQGGTPLSDAQWTQLVSVYPPAEYNDYEVVAGAMAMVAQPQLTFAPSADDEPEIADPTQRARALLTDPSPPPSVVTPEDAEAWALVLDSARATIARHASLRHSSRQHPCPLEFFAAGDIPPAYGVPASVMCDICETHQLTIPFYHCAECEFDVCAQCFMLPAPSAEEEVVHAPGPFDFVDGDESPSITISRQAIQDLLLSHGSMATMVEFFNEEGDPPTEQTLVVTMTLESLNARFASLGATPVTLAEVTQAISAVTTPPPSPGPSSDAPPTGYSYDTTLERSVADTLLNMATFVVVTPLQVTAFADGTREVRVKPRMILNPEDEDEPELGPY